MNKAYYKKRNTILIIFLMMINIINIDVVNASGESASCSSTTSPGGEGKCSGAANCPQNITACCSVSKGYEIHTNFIVNAYDMFGKTIDENFKINQETLAGTYIGLDIYERKSYSSWASYSVSAIQTYYECAHRDWIEGYGYRDTKGKWHWKSGYWGPWSYYEAIFGCAGGDTATKKTRPATPCGSAVAACAASAVPEKIELTPSYIASYDDSNDIDTLSTDEGYTGEIVYGGECASPSKSSLNGGTSGSNSLSQTCDFSYNRKNDKVCMNVKSGKVRYINNNQKCDTSVEYEVAKEDRYWKYFIPLNTNSGEDFSINLHTSGKKEHHGICESFIDTYDDYYERITDQNEAQLPKITANMTEAEKRKIKSQAKKLVSLGCYRKKTITIPIDQKFYNELEDQITFKGFNFYYKPIDINNPFPNGLNDTSIWYDWYKENKKQPDLTKSFNKATYIADVGNNANTIRNYTTKDLPYTSWKNMYVSGTSSFIEKENIVNRYVDRNSYYPLGCGPWNEKQTNEDGSNNPFYQPECDNS